MQTRELEGGGTAHEYFCKWESLPYCDATWEDSALIERKWPVQVEQFKTREAANTTPSRHCPVLRRRPKFHQVKEQPEYMGSDQVLINQFALLRVPYPKGKTGTLLLILHCFYIFYIKLNLAPSVQ